MSDFTNQGTALAVGVLVVGILIAFLLPIAVGAISEPSDAAVNQTEGETYEITSNLEGTLDSIDTTNSQATVTLNDTAENVQKTVTVDLGSNTTVSMPDGDITVSYDEETSNTSGIIGYEYPEEYGWSGGTSALYTLLPLFFVLACVLLVIGKAMNYT